MYFLPLLLTTRSDENSVGQVLTVVIRRKEFIYRKNVSSVNREYTLTLSNF